MPSATSAYLPPTGLVFDAMTATRMVESVTPFTPGRATFFFRSLALAVVNDAFDTVPVLFTASCDFEFEHAAASNAIATAVTTIPRTRMSVPPDFEFAMDADARRFGGRMFTMIPLWENGTFE